MMIRRMLALAALTVSTGAASAQVTVSPNPPAVQVQTGAAAADAQGLYRAKNLLGSRVVIQGGTAAGTIDDIVFDNGGQVEYLIVNNDGQLRSVPYTAATFSAQSSQGVQTGTTTTTTTGAVAASPYTATLNVTAQQYQTVPTFTTTTYPNFTAPTYRETTYRFYGLTPGQARRIDRQIDRQIDRR